jgi:hypothetical protein
LAVLKADYWAALMVAPTAGKKVAWLVEKMAGK